MLSPTLHQFVSDHLGPFELSSVAGGSINRAYRVMTASGACFLKCHNQAPHQMFQREAEGLQRIESVRPNTCPKVVAVHDHGLLLEWLEIVPGKAGEGCGVALGELHRHAAMQWGGQEDNYLGTLRQSQPLCSTWAELYGQYRLLPLAKDCPPRLRNGIEKLIPRLNGLLDDIDPPSHIHGDLWAGNAGTLNDHRPIFFDPAYATAHRELDLGMSLLFGGFSDDFYRAYEAIYPPQPGWRQRVPLHQLYYVLAHYHLFGAPYDEQALDTVTAFL